MITLRMLLPCLATASLTGALAVSSVITVTDGKYTSPTLEAEIVGVCQLKADAFDCWNFNRKHDDTLTARMNQDFINRRLELRFGRTNLFILVKHTSKGAYSYIRTSGNYSENGAGFGNSFDLRSDNSGVSARTQFTVLPYSPSIGEESVGFSISQTQTFSQGELRDLKVGSELTIGKATYNLSKIEKGVSRNNNGSATPNWQITLTLKDGQPPVDRIGIQATDTNGTLIQWIDIKGRPLSQYQAFNPPQATMSLGKGPQPNTLVITTNVDPSFHYRMSFSTSQESEVQFTGIPTSPLKP